MAEPRPCSVCSHPSRLAIEQALSNGKGMRPTARAFGIGSGVPGTEGFRPDHKKIERHLPHMAESLATSRENLDLISGQALGERLTYLDQVVTDTIERLRLGEVVLLDGVPVLNADGSERRRFRDGTLLMAVNEGRHNLDLRLRMTGAVGGDNADSVAQARDALQSPEARKALQHLEEVLAAVEGNGTPAGG